MDTSQVVSADEWLAARTDLLAREKEATRAKDAVDAARRALPMTAVGKQGACRIIEDRFGITGARWSPGGAEVILKIRAVAGHRPPRTRSCSCCGTKSPCCDGPTRDPASTGQTGRSSLR